MHAIVSREGAQSAETSLAELSLLVDTLGMNAVEKRTPRVQRIHPKHYLGAGQIEAIAARAREVNAAAVVFNNELSPSQRLNLEDMFELAVLTRTDVILRIFSMRARTNIAKLQVELARLTFEYPRLKGTWSTMSHTDAVTGKLGGPGETKLEYDRRHARERMHAIRRDLARAVKNMATGRKSRKDAFTCALVGYTNAGKSTLFNALCNESAYVEDKLFATLDTSTRKLYLGDDVRLDVVVSDTVGFIADLPHLLVESFTSTLAEVRDADLLVHVVDAEKEAVDRDMRSVEAVLAEIGAHDIPRLVVFNKCDRIDEYRSAILRTANPEALRVSARMRTGIDELKEKIKGIILSSESGTRAALRGNIV
ncbi:MAG: GTPase HflX [Spirochaetota bacterium]